MPKEFLDRLASETAKLHEQGLYKTERVLASPQQGTVRVQDGAEVLNLCANKRHTGRSTGTAMEWRRCASSAGRRPFTRNWSSG